MNFRQKTTRDTPEINLIPLIDVLLVVLIFLLVSTSFTRINALRVQLPDGTLSGQDNAPSIEVSLSSTGKIAINRRLLEQTDAAHLTEALIAESSGNTKNTLLVIHADAQATHQSVVTIMEAARTAGLARVSFATQNAHH